jgi:hypothetical protein
MTKLRLAAAIGVGLLLPAGVSSAIAAAAPPAAAAPAATTATTAKATPPTTASRRRRVAESPATPVVEPSALAALRRMSDYLSSLTAFGVKSDTTLDLVTYDGQRLQVDGVANYKVRRPNGFVIEVNTDAKKRTFYYNGKTITVYAPELGYYANAPAPPTIAQTLDALYDRFGISLPLEDLFRWSDPSQHRVDTVKSGFMVGPATVQGVAADQYAFREGDIDWQIWIQHDGQPLPLKLVIVDRTDPSYPAYSAVLTWDTSPALTDADFTFHPDKDAKAIRLTSAGR